MVSPVNCAGADVTLAASADETLAALRTVAVDAIVTDIGMGKTDRDGVWLFDRLRSIAQFTAIPVVALTGHKELERDLRRRGFSDVLIKPVAGDTLPLVVFRALTGHQSSS